MARDAAAPSVKRSRVQRSFIHTRCLATLIAVRRLNARLKGGRPPPVGSSAGRLDYQFPYMYC